MPIHQNSAEAYQELEAFLIGRKKEVYEWLQANGQATDREIKVGLGYDDMNAIRPRISELVEIGLIKEVGRVLDKKTLRRVRIVKTEPCQKGLF